MTIHTISTSVLISGGGPVGMTLALELGRRGVECVLLNDQFETAKHPKANAISSRSMEHFRRMGVAKEIRATGLDDDHPTDVAYFTTLKGYEVGRLEQPSRSDALREARLDASPWASPEPPQRSSQIFLERELKRKIDQLAPIDVRFGWSLETFVEEGGGVSAMARCELTGQEIIIKAKYLVGCDGPASVVRKSMGIEYQGETGVVRPMFGGPMFATYFEAKEILSWLEQKRAWQYWIVNPDIRALFVPVDSKGKFVFHFAIHDNEDRPQMDPRKYLYKAAGCEFPLTIFSTANWTAGFSLVAQYYGKGNIFIAGDAAHLFTPTGGIGMNTGIDDAVNLGWKLSAVLNGWANKKLLRSYELERRPIGERNVGYARAFADSVGTGDVSIAATKNTQEGEAERKKMAPYYREHASYEFIIPGVFLGLNYKHSPVIVYDDTAPMLDHPNEYKPNTCPGSRAPHIWIGNEPIFDHFGKEFTLVSFADNSKDTLDIETIAERMKIPLKVLHLRNKEVSALYNKKFVLVRPDHHVAWRSDVIPEDVSKVFSRICGFY